MKRLTILVFSAVFLLCSCASVPAPEPQPEGKASSSASAAAEATPTPGPAPDVQALFDEFTYEGALDLPLYPQESEHRGYEQIAAHPEVSEALHEAFFTWASAAADFISAALRDYYGDAFTGATLNVPEWQMLAAAAVGSQTPEELLAKFPSFLTPGLHVTVSDEETYSLVMEAKTPQEAFPLSGVKGDPIPSEFFTCTYLLTVYDSDMQVIENSGEEPALSERLTFPFGERYEFRNGWYNDRDGGARRHTGTDILCPEGTPELACVDGTILAVGGGEGTGNYVVLEGGDGTQYHYYHMVEVSNLVSPGDTVKRGDPVGLAGNTGNSTANHLHLAIVAPSGVYVNPYEYLKDAE